MFTTIFIKFIKFFLDPSFNTLANSLNGHSTTASDGSTEAAQNLWHGSVNTSTDTLVPMQNSSRRHSSHTDEESGSVDHVDAVSKSAVDGCNSSRLPAVSQEAATREDVSGRFKNINYK